MLAPQVNPKMRVARTKRSNHPEDTLSLDESVIEDIHENRMKLTRRRVLAFQMGQFDPL